MTRFAAITSITDIYEFSKIMFAIAAKAETPENLANELAMELSEAGLQTIRSIAQRGNYPLSLDGIQKFTDLTYSVHIFDRKGKRLVDVDQTGVHCYSEDLLISVCKETGAEWKKESMVYVSDGLIELLKKAKPNGSA